MLQPISEHVYGMLTFGSMMNFYVIVNGENLTVVDTGFGSGGIDALERALQAKGWSMQQVRHILITHAHFDHVGGLAALQARCDAQTLVHRRDANIVRGSQFPIMAPPQELGWFSRAIQPIMNSSNQRLIPARVDTELLGDETLSMISPGLRVIPLPGHSYGQCGFWLPDDELLIGGDVVMKMPWGFTRPIRPVSPDWEAVHASIRKVCELAPKILCIGHGTVTRGDVASLLQPLLPDQR